MSFLPQFAITDVDSFDRRGQEHLINKIHTPSLPGGYLWGDMMLYFLERLSAPPHFRS